MLGWHRLTVWSSFAFLPAVVVLAAGGTWLALLEAASLAVCVAYHATWEARFVEADHALAGGIIAANAWMAWHAAHLAFVAMGLGCVVLGLWRFALARRVPGAYEVEHSLWHLCCGAANVCFAVGYVGG